MSISPEARDKRWRQTCAFLHTKGYNYFSIPSLTLGEINALVETDDEKMKEQERKMRLARQRGRH